MSAARENPLPVRRNDWEHGVRNRRRELEFRSETSCSCSKPMAEAPSMCKKGIRRTQWKIEEFDRSTLVILFPFLFLCLHSPLQSEIFCIVCAWFVALGGLHLWLPGSFIFTFIYWLIMHFRGGQSMPPLSLVQSNAPQPCLLGLHI